MVLWRIDRGVNEQKEHLLKGFHEVFYICGTVMCVSCSGLLFHLLNFRPQQIEFLVYYVLVIFPTGY